jgi:hypothetical protein
MCGIGEFNQPEGYRHLKAMLKMALPTQRGKPRVEDEMSL